MKTAILIEGLFSYNVGFVRNAFSKYLINLGYEVKIYPWTYPGNLRADLVIGHSFGAKTAINQCIKSQTLITMDPRGWDFWNNSKFKKNPNVSRHVNFYQRSGLRGYEVLGAENFDMGFCGHTKLPKECFNKIIGVYMDGIE